MSTITAVSRYVRTSFSYYTAPPKVNDQYLVICLYFMLEGKLQPNERKKDGRKAWFITDYDGGKPIHEP